MRVQARGGLVEQQDLRLAEQRRSEREPPPGPVRACADSAVGHGLQAGALERLVRIAAPGARGRQRRVRARGPAGMEAVAVEHAADPAVVCARPDVGRARPNRIRSVVVFPAPFGPRKPHTLPSGTVNESPSSAVVRP